MAGVLCQQVGHRPETPDVMDTSGHDNCGPELCARRPEVTVYLWRELKDLLAQAVRHVRDFLRAHQPVTSAR